jgi:hypothetical protein
MTREQWEDLAERAARTFAQGAVASVPVSGTATDWESVRMALVAMAVGGGASLISMAQSMLRARRASSRG